jgi:hypothetical protein
MAKALGVVDMSQCYLDSVTCELLTGNPAEDPWTLEEWLRSIRGAFQLVAPQPVPEVVVPEEGEPPLKKASLRDLFSLADREQQLDEREMALARREQALGTPVAVAADAAVGEKGDWRLQVSQAGKQFSCEHALCCNPALIRTTGSGEPVSYTKGETLYFNAKGAQKTLTWRSREPVWEYWDLSHRSPFQSLREDWKQTYDEADGLMKIIWPDFAPPVSAAEREQLVDKFYAMLATETLDLEPRDLLAIIETVFMTRWKRKAQQITYVGQGLEEHVILLMMQLQAKQAAATEARGRRQPHGDGTGGGVRTPANIRQLALSLGACYAFIRPTGCRDTAADCRFKHKCLCNGRHALATCQDTRAAEWRTALGFP